MSENKFIAKMRGEKAPKSVVEIKNDRLLAPFVDLPDSTTVSDGFENEAGHSIVVAKSAQNWALQKSGIEPMVGVDTAEYSGQIAVKYDGLWVNSSYTFPLSGNEANPVVAIINPCAKWVLNFVGKDLFSDKNTINFTLVVKIGSTHISNRDFVVKRQAGFFCQKFIIDFSESEQELIKVNGGEKLTVQLLCNDDMATAVYYTGLSVLTLLQRKIDGDTVASDTKTFNEVVEDIDDIRKDIDERFFGVYKFKGTVPTVADLPATGNTIGDTYNIAETGSNYAWDGQNWDKLSETLDLTPYQKIENITQTLEDDSTKYPSSKAVKDAVDKKDSYPEQIGHEGEFLQTNGDKTSWAKPLPVQKDNAGKFLATDGKNAKWEKPLPEQSGNSGKFLKTNGTEAEWESIRQLPAPEDNNAKVLMNKDGQAYWDYIPSAVPLLFTVWSDHVINDVSWLRADTFSWQSGDVYKSVYDHLVDDWNNATSVSETVNGHTFSVMVAEDGHKLFSMNGHDLAQTLYDETGIAWYYVLDRENKRFKLPRTKFGFTGLRDSVGGYVEAGLPNITGSATSFFTGSSRTASGCLSYGSVSEAVWVGNSNARVSTDIKFDASDSNSTYGNSDTVQPPATQMYLYFYVGNYTKDQYTVDIGKVSELINDFDFETSRKAINDVRDAAITAVNAEREDSLQDIETARDNSVSQLESMGNALNHTNITNCVTKIPQDIKLELADGVLTLKAGSKVYVPNGSGKFDEVVIQSDITTTSNTNRNCLFFVNNSKVIECYPTTICYSGATAPTSSQYMMWYDTTTNTVKKTSDTGATWTSGISLPIGLFTESTNGISSIDQVFNGFGYIGSTVFALPGVEVLIPNGRNEDGSLHNVKVITSKVLTESGGGTNQKDIYYGITNTGKLTLNGVYHYDNVNNFAYDGTTKVGAAFVGGFNKSNSEIVDFTAPVVFHAVDYSDFAAGDYVIKTYVSGTTWYRKYKSGWVEQGGSTMTGSQTVTFLIPFKSVPTMTWGFCTKRSGASYDGEVFFRSITATNFVSGSRMTNAISPGFMWRAEGMAA